MRKSLSVLLLAVLIGCKGQDVPDQPTKSSWWGPKGWGQSEMSEEALSETLQTLHKDASNDQCGQLIHFVNPSNTYAGVTTQTWDLIAGNPTASTSLVAYITSQIAAATGALMASVEALPVTTFTNDAPYAIRGISMKTFTDVGTNHRDMQLILYGIEMGVTPVGGGGLLHVELQLPAGTALESPWFDAGSPYAGGDPSSGGDGLLVGPVDYTTSPGNAIMNLSWGTLNTAEHSWQAVIRITYESIDAAVINATNDW